MSCHATVDKLEPAIERRSNPETSVISVHNQPAVHHQVLPGDAARQRAQQHDHCVSHFFGRRHLTQRSAGGDHS
jgi:hypothetical protein